MDSAASSDDDLAEFLAGLRARYNLDATAVTGEVLAPSAVLSTSAAAAHDTATPVGPYNPASPQQRQHGRPAISTDAAILGLHPAFRGSISSPSQPSGQLTATPDPAASGSIHTAATGRQLHSPAAGGVLASHTHASSPGAISESGSCSTPRPALFTASQLGQGAACSPQASPAPALGSPPDWPADQVAAAAAGAVAAVATPHSTAAMPNKQHVTPVRDQARSTLLPQLNQAGYSSTAGAAADSTAHVAGAAAGPSAPAAAGTAGAHRPPETGSHSQHDRPSSCGSGSVSQQLQGAAAPPAAQPQSAGAAATSKQQQQQQHQVEASSGSELTLQALAQSPPQQQQQQQPTVAGSSQPSSPVRPLLGVWAIRAAAADRITGSASRLQPQQQQQQQQQQEESPAGPVELLPASSGVGAAGSTADSNPEPPVSQGQLVPAAAAGIAVLGPAPLHVIRSDHQASGSRPAGQQSAAGLKAATTPTGTTAEFREADAAAAAAASAQHPGGAILQGFQTQQQQQQQQEKAAEKERGEVTEVPGVQQEQLPLQADSTVDWQQLSMQLSSAGFGRLTLVQQQQAAAAHEPGGHPQQAALLPELHGLFHCVSKVVREYMQCDSRLQQLLAERDEVRRASRRSNSETARLEHERDEAARAAARAKAELSDVRALEIPALEARHKEALSRLSSEASRLKHALKEAEAAAAAATAAAAASTSQATLQGQLQEALRERERVRLECERLESELSRQRPLIKELEKAAAAARTAARQSADQAVLLDKQLRQLRQQYQDDLTATTAELNKARHAAREAEHQAASLRAEAAASSNAAPELQRQLAAQAAQHEEQQAHLTSELQALRQQLLQLQQAAAKAEAAAKTDSSAVMHAQKQLALQEKQHAAEVAKLTAEVRQARQSLQLLQGKLLQAEAAASEQSTAAVAAEAAARESADRLAEASAELDRVRSSSLQQQQQLSERLQDSKRKLTEVQQQLASAQGELRRLRAATHLADVAALLPSPATTAAAAAAAAGASNTPSGATAVDDDSSGAHSSSLARGAAGGGAGGTAGHAAAMAAAAALASSDVTLAAALSRAVAAEAALSDAEGALVGQRYRALQLEQAVSRKEQELEAVREKLAQKVVKEERRLARDKATYQRIKQAYAVSGNAAAGRRAALAAAAGADGWPPAVEVGPGGGASARRSAGAGGVAAAARELRPVELVGLYEGQKEALEKELAAAKAEVRVLSCQLRDAQNLLISRDRAAAVAAAAAGAKGGQPAHLCSPASAAASQRKAAELQRELCTVRAEAANALREAAKRLAEAEAEVTQLRGDVAALQEELDNRPTAADQRRLEREVDLLQRKIAALRRQAAAGQLGGAAAAGEDALAAAVAAGDVWGPDDRALAVAVGSGRWRGTRAAIERDKAVARLGLGVVEELPRDVLVDTVQDACIVLQLHDPTLMVASLKQVAAVAAAIPSVEAFVAQVCELVLREGLPFVPPATQDTRLSPQCVPQVLQHWLVLLRQGQLLAQCAEDIQQLLAQRCSTAAPHGAGATPTAALAAAGVAGDSAAVQQLCQQLLQGVQELLRVEAEAVAAEAVWDAARGLVASEPEGLLQRLVLQLMELMGVDSLEGLPAAANRVYVHYSELLNFLRAVNSVLALPAEAGPTAAIAALAKVVEASARPPSKVRQAAAELQAAAGLTHPQQRQHGAADSADAAGPDTAAAAAAAASAAERLSGLLAVLGAADEQQAADRHNTMVARLRRLDQVLPKYQSIVSQLYDKLRVVSLDELLPAVERLLQLQQLAAASR